MNIFRLLALLPFLCLSLLASAQSSQAARINVFLEGADAAKVGDEVTLVIEVEPKTEWHVYSGAPSEEGVYRPAEIGWEIDSRGFEVAGEMKEDGHMIARVDDVLGGTVRYYKDKVVFTQRVKVTEPELKIVGFFDYMACNEFQCIPFTAEFELQAAIAQ